ncbi:MAG: YcxB family protein [Planctomycetota bacterium]
MDAKNPYASPAAPLDSEAVTLQPPQAITVELHTDDYVAFVTHLNRENATVKQMLWRRIQISVLVGVVCLIAAVALQPLRGGPAVRGMLHLVGVSCIVTGALQFPLARWRARRRIKRLIRMGLYGGTAERLTVSIDGRGVRLEERGGHAVRYWAAVPVVAATESHLFVYLRSVEAAIVPRRCFQTDGHFLGYCELAGRLWREHRHSPASTNGSRGV